MPRPENSLDDCYVGIDIGTSGCRAMAIDAKGRALAESRAPLPASQRPRPGASEQSPQDWWQVLHATLNELTSLLAASIRSISVDGTSSSLLLCDAAGEPLTPALMYDDRRALKQAELVARFAPVDSPARGPGSALSKALHLLNRLPNGEAAHALHQADWINGKLSGEYGVSDENNALKLGYDPLARRWPAWLDQLPIAIELLPRVYPVGKPIGTISADIARHLGLQEGIMLVAGTTDSNAACLAAGIAGPGDAVTSLGSTLVLKVYSNRSLSSSKYGIYSHRIGDGWLTGGASNAGGTVLRKYFTDAEIAQLSRELDPANPLNLGYYPLPDIGERFPRSDSQMKPLLQPRPDDRRQFLQAILEGIADIEAEGYMRLAELGAPFPQRVFTSGGGAVNKAWREIRQQRLRIPILEATQTQAAYGAALLARKAALGQL